jgi:hypothetical protein
MPNKETTSFSISQHRYCAGRRHCRADAPCDECSADDAGEMMSVRQDQIEKYASKCDTDRA